MIILGSVVNISIAALFIAGLVPAIVNGLFVMGITYLFALRLGLATEPWMGLAGILKAGRAAFLPLVMPVIILGGILTGVFTPTEAAVVAVVYALLPRRRRLSRAEAPGPSEDRLLHGEDRPGWWRWSSRRRARSRGC
jgi:TRAP-type C4-dicarboxylate transport system permease large subunit